jgi:subtilisin family serine protease
VKRHKASNNINAAVMTMSLAGPRSQSLNDAIDAASNAGITVITAAGEGGRFRLEHFTQTGSGHDAALSHGDITVISPSCSALSAIPVSSIAALSSGPLATLKRLARPERA